MTKVTWPLRGPITETPVSLEFPDDVERVSALAYDQGHMALTWPYYRDPRFS